MISFDFTVKDNTILQKGNLILLTAGPAMGKTSFALS